PTSSGAPATMTTSSGAHWTVTTSCGARPTTTSSGERRTTTSCGALSIVWTTSSGGPASSKGNTISHGTDAVSGGARHDGSRLGGGVAGGSRRRELAARAARAARHARDAARAAVERRRPAARGDVDGGCRAVHLAAADRRRRLREVRRLVAPR